MAVIINGTTGIDLPVPLAVVDGGTGITTFDASASVSTTDAQTLTNKTLSTGSTWNGNAIGVAYGGTGVATLTSNAVILGNGTGAVQAVAPGASGNVLTSNGTTWASTTPGASGATLSDDTATNTTQYIGMARATSGAWTAAYVASTKLYFNPSTGTLNATILNALSDISTKENIVNITNATDIVDQLQGVEFTWKDNGNKSSGVIAQDIEKVLPHLVETNEDGLKSVNYSGLVGYFIETIKELNSRVKELEAK